MNANMVHRTFRVTFWPGAKRRANNVDPVVVHFVLKRHWHTEMLSGRKDIEYRAITPFWTARLMRRPVTHAAFSRGYTARGRFIRPVTQIDIGPCPYPGWTGDFYRVHLGPIMPNAGAVPRRGSDVGTSPLLGLPGSGD